MKYGRSFLIGLVIKMERKLYTKNIKWDKEELRRLYWDEGLNCRQIALRYNSYQKAVDDVMKRLGIERRDRHQCSKGSRSCRWKGGQRMTFGYIEVTLFENDFFFRMANKRGYVREHRLVMAKHLGRCLQCWEIVHHINHIRTDNRIENLQLVTDDRHKQITILEKRITYLEKRIALLEAENVILRKVA